MSELKDRLRADLTEAIKARETLKSSTLRMVLTAITNAEVSGKASREL
ncbi:MAG TPA: GatB/YqeY domain-containing protein, partial [Marmoricola sp.]|nr:GatB/YqeY domain-containing protein [Marmoricola sp.]